MVLKVVAGLNTARKRLLTDREQEVTQSKQINADIGRSFILATLLFSRAVVHAQPWALLFSLWPLIASVYQNGLDNFQQGLKHNRLVQLATLRTAGAVHVGVVGVNEAAFGAADSRPSECLGPNRLVSVF